MKLLQSCNILYIIDKKGTHSWKTVHKFLRSLHWVLLPTPHSFSKLLKYNHRPNYYCYYYFLKDKVLLCSPRWPRVCVDPAGVKPTETCPLVLRWRCALASPRPPPLQKDLWQLEIVVFWVRKASGLFISFCIWHKGVVFSLGSFKIFPFGLALASGVRYPGFG